MFSDLPLGSDYRDVAISVRFAAVAVIDFTGLVPKQIRGMAAYIAEDCSGHGTGGFMIPGIQDLVDDVTDLTGSLMLGSDTKSSAPAD